MGRWEPDAAGRLRTAALELFEEVGFDQATVAEISERAGVTSRTFFRYFADKQEVLFAGSENLGIEMAAALTAAPADASARRALDAALDQAASLLTSRADFARRRHAVVSSNPALRERETMKMDRLTETLAAALRDRGVADPLAIMTAHVGVAAFRVAFDAWAQDPAIDLRTAMAANLAALSPATG
ncbi:TetR family transcriptional regulator [Microbacterium sp. 8M]|uniref:TetR family transcriptional regulator n=1 Tax=Microbacterium sp. 8M TaxID=2653153 RepID=UPI0012F36B1F|nr:TetR family transcriptional regulator [Microbacterium sp. 8M]VXB49622.1 TetR family transcriptional regulator [Microbacterium sp. 8M]